MSPPPRFSTRRPAPRARRSSAKESVFCADRPSRSRVVMTRVSPSWIAPEARSKFGRKLEHRKHPDLCRCNRDGCRRRGDAFLADQSTTVAPMPARTRSAFSHARHVSHNPQSVLEFERMLMKHRYEIRDNTESDVKESAGIVCDKTRRISRGVRHQGGSLGFAFSGWATRLVFRDTSSNAKES